MKKFTCTFLMFMILGSLTLNGQTISLSGVVHPNIDNWSGANGVNIIQNKGLGDPSIDAPLHDQYFSTIRYPGGTVGNFWNAYNGWFLKVNPELPSELWTPWDYSNLTLLPDRLQDLRKHTEGNGARPIWMLNAVSSDLIYQLGMLYYAKALRFPVTHAEIGNELYLDKPENNYLFGDGGMWIFRTKCTT